MEKKGLGRGLSALIPVSEPAENATVDSELDVAAISANPYQPRKHFDDDKFQDLVNSVRVHGVLQPIVVRSKGNGVYELVAGERRLRAAKTAGLRRIPAVIREMTNEQSLQVALIENIQREDINSIDAAQAYRRLADEFGLSQEDLAFQIGKSRSSVANTMRLLNLPEDVRECIKSGRVSEGHARALLSVDGADSQSSLCKKIISAGLSVREAERLSKEWNRVAEGGSVRENVSRETMSARQDPNILEIESHLRQLLGTKVSLIKNKDRGRIEIEFYSDDDLDRILTLFCGA